MMVRRLHIAIVLMGLLYLMTTPVAGIELGFALSEHPKVEYLGELEIDPFRFPIVKVDYSSMPEGSSYVFSGIEAVVLTCMEPPPYGSETNFSFNHIYDRDIIVRDGSQVFVITWNSSFGSISTKLYVKVEKVGEKTFRITELNNSFASYLNYWEVGGALYISPFIHVSPLFEPDQGYIGATWVIVEDGCYPVAPVKYDSRLVMGAYAEHAKLDYNYSLVPVPTGLVMGPVCSSATSMEDLWYGKDVHIYWLPVLEAEETGYEYQSRWGSIPVMRVTAPSHVYTFGNYTNVPDERCVFVANESELVPSPTYYCYEEVLPKPPLHAVEAEQEGSLFVVSLASPSKFTGFEWEGIHLASWASVMPINEGRYQPVGVVIGGGPEVVWNGSMAGRMIFRWYDRGVAESDVGTLWIDVRDVDEFKIVTSKPTSWPPKGNVTIRTEILGRTTEVPIVIRRGDKIYTPFMLGDSITIYAYKTEEAPYGGILKGKTYVFEAEQGYVLYIHEADIIGDKPFICSWSSNAEVYSCVSIEGSLSPAWVAQHGGEFVERNWLGLVASGDGYLQVAILIDPWLEEDDTVVSVFFPMIAPRKLVVPYSKQRVIEEIAPAIVAHAKLCNDTLLLLIAIVVAATMAFTYFVSAETLASLKLFIVVSALLEALTVVSGAMLACSFASFALATAIPLTSLLVLVAVHQKRRT